MHSCEMRSHRLPLAAIAIVCCMLAACGDDKPAASGASGATTASSPTAAPGDTTAASSGSDSTSPPGAIGNGDLDCEALKTTLAGLTVNWQVVIGLVNAPTSAWHDIPLGNLTEFGNQLEVTTAALGKNSQAAGALSYMSGANDIVVRGLGGDTAAQADLTAYLGPDAGVSVNKQIPIALAFQNAGCS